MVTLFLQLTNCPMSADRYSPYRNYLTRILTSAVYDVAIQPVAPPR